MGNVDSEPNQMEFRVDFRFMYLEDELWALGEYLETIEQQMPLLAEQQEHNYIEKLKSLGPDDPEMDSALYMAYHFKEDALPRLLRGPYLTALWAVFESGVYEIAAYIQKQKGAALGLRDIRGDHVLDQSQKYFAHILQFPFLTDNVAEEQLNMLRVLRNALAHANGRLTLIRPDDQKRIREWEQLGKGVSVVDNNLVLSQKFLQDAYCAVNETLRVLAQRVRDAF